METQKGAHTSARKEDEECALVGLQSEEGEVECFQCVVGLSHPFCIQSLTKLPYPNSVLMHDISVHSHISATKTRARRSV